ncbi:hypothetical protein BGI09_01710 [Snodgrassella alvi]|nr:hypothetical protein BGI09_01710 [Snodgrassella alvi]PXY98458.1 hypothetical protein DKK71_02695 [Snodgrassella alvi]
MCLIFELMNQCYLFYILDLFHLLTIELKKLYFLTVLTKVFYQACITIKPLINQFFTKLSNIG